MPRLGVNIDHIATLRQLRGTPYPDLLEAARIVEDAGAQQITVHLREDRRHIQDQDVKDLRAKLRVPLNLEMCLADEIVRFAKKIRPDWACLVPEKRAEVTTEGGLNLLKTKKRAAKVIQDLKKQGTKVSLFIEPSVQAVKLSQALGADAVEFHTGHYCILSQMTNPPAKKIEAELKKLETAAKLALQLGIHPHAGHGLDYDNVRPVVVMDRGGGAPLIEEYNIGHVIVCRAALVGLGQAVREMVSAIAAP
ncbi:MAG: pyridoxine 5'-phosphate synthase [Bacteriovoracia bacterium]